MYCAISACYGSDCGPARESERLTAGLKLETEELTVFEGDAASYIQVSSFLPPRLYCEAVDRDRDCYVLVTPQLLRKNKEVMCPSQDTELAQVVFFTDPELSDADRACAYTLTMSNWQQDFRIPLTGAVDGLKDGRKNREVKVQAKIYASGLLYETITLGEVEVEVKDRDRRSTCAATGDPHIKTFDKK